MYTQSKIVLRYVGHPEHRARDRNTSIGEKVINRDCDSFTIPAVINRDCDSFTIPAVINRDCDSFTIPGRSGGGAPGGRHAPMPAYLDEVTVLQQPRGSYSLEVRPNILPKIRTQDKRLQSIKR